jgi:parallel beta-helix repeat protein
MNRTTVSTPTVLSLSALALLITGAVLYAGPLDPPAGPVAPTYKTLTEVEPRTAINAANTPGVGTSIFRISAPGSYYLTGNLTGAAGRHGIEIAASDVSVDLMGFEVSGVPGSLNGIATTATSLTGLSIVNGTVVAWGLSGIDLQSNGATSSRVAGVVSNSNGQSGILVGQGTTVTNCVAASNLSWGFAASTGCVFEACIARTNTGGGMSIGFGSTATDCTAASNTGTGISGGAGCSVRGCTAFFCGSDGISVGNGSVVVHSSCLGNTTNGIRATFGVAILDNACQQNGNSGGSGAGILVTGSDCRVEGNTCSNADRGVEVTGAGNLIVRNACAQNTTDWVIAANNIHGPIIDRRVPASAAVNGFAATTTLGSADPNANLSY